MRTEEEIAQAINLLKLAQMAMDMTGQEDNGPMQMLDALAWVLGHQSRLERYLRLCGASKKSARKRATKRKVKDDSFPV